MMCGWVLTDVSCASESASQCKLSIASTSSSSSSTSSSSSSSSHECMDDENIPDSSDSTPNDSNDNTPDDTPDDSSDNTPDQVITLSVISARPVERGERGESFPGPRDVLGAPPSLKNTEKGVPDGFFRSSNMHKSIFGRGSAPDPAGGAYDASRDPLSGGESTHLPRFPPYPRLRCLDLGT